ncbi:MAG TPA: hypothetical protein VGV64_04585, partial [Thermoplasmata archaeon]|nr:hypothetical protein [Thermoplasmata archaeon]
MASSAPAVEAGSPAPPAIDAARKLHKSAEEAEASQNRERFQQQLKAYLAFVEDRRAELGDFGPELAHQLDDAAMAFYRMSSPDLALRSVDLGLGFSAHAPALLHHKALFLLAANRDTAQVVPLLEEAARGDPNDKSIWATLGDALKVAGRPRDAADAYLRAQQLDATSTQYVEKALRLVPGHPEALRQSLQLAKGLGGNQQALEACEALLSTSPNDPELLFARVELLAELGQIGAALDAVAPARQARPGDPKLALLAGRLQVAADHPTDAIAEFQMGVEAADRLSSTDLSDLAERIESTGIAPELAIRARELFRAREPRNLANLTALRFLAQRSRKFDLGISACRQILEVSPGNLEATRALAEFLMTSQKTEE